MFNLKSVIVVLSATLVCAAAGAADGPGVQRLADFLKGQGAGAQAGIQLPGGVYTLDAPWALTAADSGTPEHPAVVEAAPGASVRLVGGKRLQAFAPVADAAILGRLAPEARGHVLQCDMRAKGVESAGDLPIKYEGAHGTLEVFFNGEPMRMARWPNEGWAVIRKTLDPGPINDKEEEAKRGGTFYYSGDRPARWGQAHAIWLQGYWRHDWSDECIKVASIDPAKRTITLAAGHNYGIGGAPNRRYYAFNLLEELDAPGEWYVDRAAGVLYFWPPADIASAEVIVSTVSDPLVNVEGAHDLVFRRITFEMGRGLGARIRGGANVRFEGCTFRNLGDRAIEIKGGEGHGIVSCDIYNCGAGGIDVEAGDIPSLTPSHCAILNNDIHDFARVARTQSPAIKMEGVGIHVAHNFIREGPHIAIYFRGNDHCIECNDFARLCTETDDTGVIYSGRNWAHRGTVIRYNVFREIGTAPKQQGVRRKNGAHCVYLDDLASGTTVSGNIFIGGRRNVFIGGGRDNIVENNLFVNCRHGIHLDARAIGWAKDLYSRNGRNDMYKRLEALPYREEPWRSRYPELATILENEPAQPRGNRFVRNVSWGGELIRLSFRVKKAWITIEDNIRVRRDPGFVDAAALDYRLAPDSPLLKMGFQPIPIEQIGLIQEGLRKELPRGRAFERVAR